MLPSLNALRAFDTAAGTGSFKSAAEALHVSPTAISHHIRGLEQELGVALFHRDGRRITLTPEGRQLSRDVAQAFVQLDKAVARARRAKTPQAIRIAAGPFFAARWLMPRLAHFWAEHPDLALEVVPVPRKIDDRDINADIVIEWGDRTQNAPEPLLDLRPVAIACPDLIERLGRPKRPADLLKMPLIHQRDTSSWADWFRAMGVDAPGLTGAMFEDANAVLRGATEGHAVTLGWLPLIESELETGRLVRLFDETVGSKKQYHIRVPHDGDQGTNVLTIVQWLKREGAASSTPL